MHPAQQAHKSGFDPRILLLYFRRLDMNILSFAGSLRKDSSNKKFAREAVRLLEQNSQMRAEYLDLRDYPMPVYDGDIERNEGVPNIVTRLGGKIAQTHALIVATPEYNGSISSVLKNTIDWVSRLKPMPLAGKHLLLLSASPGAWGGIRGLWHSRVPFARRWAFTYFLT
jgi:chromate reductase, NAD(P)H dehydrogenase (quinone)